MSTALSAEWIAEQRALIAQYGDSAADGLGADGFSAICDEAEKLRAKITALEDGVLTVDELAALLKVPRSTCYEQIAAGKIPGVRKVGRHLRILRSAVLASFPGVIPSPRARPKS